MASKDSLSIAATCSCLLLRGVVLFGVDFLSSLRSTGILLLGYMGHPLQLAGCPWVPHSAHYPDASGAEPLDWERSRSSYKLAS
ncbi:hypothetical protein D910_06329 [Dendroctonus ponderosae]|uniref:Uncharacterized protein n=1 Tax=Dendroctonus ponderosae TaxID=77166 RepID=U4UED2_DENPD|nr:hypothetical protein D910_06329 [Dendroctonus ponderosae]